MANYLDYPRVFDIAAQLYADQLSEDQRFHLQNELDDEAVMNILGHCILCATIDLRLIFRLQAFWGSTLTLPKSRKVRPGAIIISKRRQE